MIQIRTFSQVIFGLVGMIVLPVTAFVWALVQYKTPSIWFLWNIVYFGNCLALTVIVQKATLRKVIAMALNPNIIIDRVSV